MKRFLFLPLLIFVFTVNAQNSFSLEEAVQYGLKSNPNIKLSDADFRDSDEQIIEFRAFGMPKLFGTAGWTHYFEIPTQIIPDFLSPAVDSRLVDYSLIREEDKMQVLAGGFPAQFGTKNTLDAGLNLEVLLFDGSFLIGLKAMKMARELYRLQTDVTEREVKMNIQKAYLNVLLGQQNQQIISRNISNLEKVLFETEQIYKEGFAEKLDVDRLSLSFENLKRTSQTVDRVVEISINVLKFQLGYPLDQDLGISDSFEDYFITSRIDNIDQTQVTYTNRPEYKVLQQADILNKMNVKRLKAAYLPTLRGFTGLSGTLQRTDLFAGDENGWTPTLVGGLTLHVPIYDGQEKQAAINRAKISDEKNLIQMNQFEQGMNLEVENSRINYNNSIEALENTDRSLKLAESIFETTQIKYREGVGSSIELNQAERDLYNAQANFVNAQFDLMIASLDLKNALGIN